MTSSDLNIAKVGTIIDELSLSGTFSGTIVSHIVTIGAYAEIHTHMYALQPFQFSFEWSNNGVKFATSSNDAVPIPVTPGSVGTPAVVIFSSPVHGRYCRIRLLRTNGDAFSFFSTTFASIL